MTVDPIEHDTKIAALYHELEKAKQQVFYATDTLLRLAGAEYHWSGSKRVTAMSVDEAETLVAMAVRHLQRHEANHFGEGRWVSYEGLVAPRDKRRAEETLDARLDCLEAVDNIQREIIEAEQAYTGWSRFFLVTSSQGHIHSSMYCSSCRPTTTFGWLPELSGKDEEAAVKAHGPALCSVCYPSAPTEWTSEKVKKAAANKAVA